MKFFKLLFADVKPVEISEGVKVEVNEASRLKMIAATTNELKRREALQWWKDSKELKINQFLKDAEAIAKRGYNKIHNLNYTLNYNGYCFKDEFVKMLRAKGFTVVSGEGDYRIEEISW